MSPFELVCFLAGVTSAVTVGYLTHRMYDKETKEEPDDWTIRWYVDGRLQEFQNELEERLRRLNDRVSDIDKVLHSYGYYVDEN